MGQDLFNALSTTALARRLLGCILIHECSEGIAAGRIVETEAYLHSVDPASHSHGGKTARNAAMFGNSGHAYIYFIYGRHHCFNVVSGKTGEGEAVLIRALEPVGGIDLMARRRGLSAEDRDLTNGPAKLVEALAIRRDQNGIDLRHGALRIQWEKAVVPSAIIAGPRIGISKARDMPLRFVVKGSHHLSKPLR